MPKIAIAMLVASIAIAANGITYKPFVRGFEHRAEPVITETFVGAEWPCVRSEETCFAGFRLATQELVTGP